MKHLKKKKTKLSPKRPSSAHAGRRRMRGPRVRSGPRVRQPAGPVRLAQARADGWGLWSKGPRLPETQSRGGADRGKATATNGVFAVVGKEVSGGRAQEL
jgi:hypothetical protein